MSTTSPILPEYTGRVPSVTMGQQGYLNVMLRLIAMDLYKIRRRLMSKVLASVCIGTVALASVVISLYVLTDVNKPASSFAPIQCSQVINAKSPLARKCLDHQPTQAELDTFKHTRIVGDSEILRLPDSLEIGIVLGLNIFTILAIVLVGTLVGGEYSLGTVRLMFTRGPTRLQFLLAKIVVAVICIVPVILAMALIGVLLGFVLNPISGVAPDYSFLNAAWLSHIPLYLLAAIFTWFVFGMIALFFGTVGRSSIAGVVGGLIWLLIEPILGEIIALVIRSIPSSGFTDFLNAIPNYFVGNNTSALVSTQAHYLFGSDLPTITVLHAILMLASYLVVFIGLSCLITVRRDVTN